MAEISDYIPTNGIRYDEAFERLFDMDPRAAELRAMLNEGTESDSAMDQWESTRKRVDLVLRTELRHGALKRLPAGSVHGRAIATFGEGLGRRSHPARRRVVVSADIFREIRIRNLVIDSL